MLRNIHGHRLIGIYIGIYETDCLRQMSSWLSGWLEDRSGLEGRKPGTSAPVALYHSWYQTWNRNCAHADIKVVGQYCQCKIVGVDGLIQPLKRKATPGTSALSQRFITQLTFQGVKSWVTVKIDNCWMYCLIIGVVPEVKDFSLTENQHCGTLSNTAEFSRGGSQRPNCLKGC